MQNHRLIALLIGLSLLLCGCGQSDEVESRAYVLVLGIDRTENGDIGLTVRVPKIGNIGSESSQKESAPDSPYLAFSTSGDTLYQALENLQWIVPRTLSLSHLKLLVISEELASEEDFKTTLNAVAELRHLYTAAKMVVSTGKAKDLVETLDLVIDARLSSEITMAFHSLEKQGSIPESSLAEVYYAGNSIYADPVAPLGFVVVNNDPATSESTFSALAPEVELSQIQAPGAVHLLGAAVFRNGSLAVKLNSEETLALNLINRGVQAFDFAYEGGACQLVSSGHTQKTVSIAGNRVALELILTLSTLDPIDGATTRSIEAAIGSQLLSTIENCQRANVDPFGFAEKAAQHFVSIQDWLSFHWRDHFADADVSVRVRINRQ